MVDSGFHSRDNVLFKCFHFNREVILPCLLSNKTRKKTLQESRYTELFRVFAEALEPPFLSAPVAYSMLIMIYEQVENSLDEKLP